MKMRVLASLCALVLGCCTFSFAQIAGEIPADAKQLAPGVYEWMDNSGSTVQAAEGIEALDWMIARAEARIEELSAENPLDTGSLSAALKHRARLLDYRNKMLEDVSLVQQPCFCPVMQTVWAGLYQHPVYTDYYMAEASASAKACAGWTFNAMAAAVGVTSGGTKQVDCDYDGGTSAYTFASISTGFSAGQCRLAEAYLWIDKPTGCEDVVIHRIKTDGDYGWKCTYNPCG